MSDLSLNWHNIVECGVEGKGWADTESAYDRLPARAKGVVTEAVWDHSHSSIGMCAHFNTDSSRIHARWQLAWDQLGEDNFNVCGFSGVDLYALDHETQSWKWASAPPHFCIKDKNPDTVIIDNLTREMRQYRLYLPLRNPVLKVEIGIDEQAIFEPVPPRKRKPLVYYGTSIAHGAFAVRAGLSCPQILGRRLDLPLINLGFSGSAKMEPELAEIIAELDAAIFVLDALPNMTEALVSERAEIFIRTICAAHPDTPVILVEDHPRMTAWLRPYELSSHQAKWQAFTHVYQRLLDEGIGNLSYVKGDTLFGTDNEASMDGIHPSDLGYMRMADILEPVLRKALG